MASLRQIKRRMKSVENINEITKAMEMIAAFRFKKAEGRFSKSRYYLSELETILANVSAAAANLKHPLFEKRELKKKTLLVLTGDKGLCGAYNSNLVKQALLWIKQNAAYEPTIASIGKVGSEALRKRKANMILSYADRSLVDTAYAKKLNEELIQLFLSGKTDSIEILYTSYKAGGSGPTKILPFLSLGYMMETEKKATTAVEYIYEPDFDTVFFSLLAKFLEGKVYLTLLESLTSEYAARMSAMKQASENGEEVLDNLKLLRNKTRQATITRELSEIVGGAAVLV